MLPTSTFFLKKAFTMKFWYNFILENKIGSFSELPCVLYSDTSKRATMCVPKFFCADTAIVVDYWYDKKIEDSSGWKHSSKLNIIA